MKLYLEIDDIGLTFFSSEGRYEKMICKKFVRDYFWKTPKKLTVWIEKKPKGDFKIYEEEDEEDQMTLLWSHKSDRLEYNIGDRSLYSGLQEVLVENDLYNCRVDIYFAEGHI